jgi:hypothetical protein
MGREIHKRVTFRGEMYWYSRGQYGIQLAPIDHFDEEGNLLADPFDDVCFAIVMNGEIWRFGQKIGTESEIQDVIDVTNTKELA